LLKPENASEASRKLPSPSPGPELPPRGESDEREADESRDRPDTALAGEYAIGLCRRRETDRDGDE
jgi:hypothetical protein